MFRFVLQHSFCYSLTVVQMLKEHFQMFQEIEYIEKIRCKVGIPENVYICQLTFNFDLQPKRKKYNKSNLLYTAKSERYKSNQFKQNEKKKLKKGLNAKSKFLTLLKMFKTNNQKYKMLNRCHSQNKTSNRMQFKHSWIFYAVHDTRIYHPK